MIAILLRRCSPAPTAAAGRAVVAVSALFSEVARRTGIACTAYSLRHSNIVRALLAGVPTRVVASSHDTSTTILERVYSAFILDHADAVARRGLLDTAQPAADNVVTLPGRR